jgi:thiol:disulfide interchange protein DsbD
MKILSKRLLFVLLSILNYGAIYTKSHKFHEPKIAISIEHADAHEDQNAIINFEVELAKGQQVYANSVYLSIDAPEAPNITLSKPELNQNAQIEDDSSIDDAAMLKGIFTISSIASYKENINQPVNLHLSFLLNHPKRILEKVFSINLPQKNSDELDQNLEEAQTPVTQLSYNELPSAPGKQATWWDSIAEFSTWLQASLRTSNSLALRLILVFLLGLLMSLTPCIYPMIPITAGILQAQGSSSLGRSFLLAFIYTLGTSTTFAVFGLIAALTHHLFGQLLVNPIFILGIVALLGYLGLSMFGLYDMYVPKFMSQSSYTQKKGSLLSVFLFGVISGSMASPCLSPGLALLLSIVATLGSKFLGFIMLFVFGLGLSMPLLIIGTFSSSINRLPQSGMWMVEIKKIFGFMLLGMCIYLLSNIVSPLIIAWMIVAFVFGSGVYYLQNALRQEGHIWYLIKNFLGSALIILAVVMGVQTIYKTYFTANLVCENSTWQTDYNLAFQKAQEQDQNLLIDCGADWCSICKSIDKYVFEDHAVKAALCSLIAVKVNATDQYSEPYQTLKTQYGIKGVPAILLINPKTGELLARWGSDLYDLPKAEFVRQLAEFKA